MTRHRSPAEARQPRRALLPLLLIAALIGAACRGDEQPSSDAVREGAAPAVTRWRVSETSFGPVQYGMTLDEASAVVGGRLAPEEPLDSTCDYVEPRGLADGVAFMVVGNVIARVDVRDSSVTTTEGARVGDDEARIRSLYGERLTVEPHHYVSGGHYLVVAPRDRGDTTHLIIFETDGKRVREYRAGREPEVTWVEGCA